MTRWGRLRRLGLYYPVATAAVAGLALAWLGHVRLGGFTLAAALAVAGTLRAVRPQARVGGLAIRRPWIDVVCWWGLAVVVAVAFTLVRLD